MRKHHSSVEFTWMGFITLKLTFKSTRVLFSHLEDFRREDFIIFRFCIVGTPFIFKSLLNVG